MRRVAWVLLLAALQACAAGGADPQGAAEAGDDSSVTLVLTLSPGAGGPIWLFESDAESQPRWVAIRRDGAEAERVFLRERCAIPECGGDQGVCGMALPVVRRLEPGDSIHFEWDGRSSRTRMEGQCEIRETVPRGGYTAEFCWTPEEPDPASDPLNGPSLTGVRCQNRPFEMPAAGRVSWVVE